MVVLVPVGVGGGRYEQGIFLKIKQMCHVAESFAKLHDLMTVEPQDPMTF